jgi:glycosyltransferase involved in cell wall biosynthesis
MPKNQKFRAKTLMVLEHDFPPDLRVENEIHTLCEAGFNVHLACLSKNIKNYKDRFNTATIYRKPITRFVDKSRVGALKLPIYFNYWRKYLAELIIQEKFDVLHIHDLPLARIGYELAHLNNLFLILDLHENWPALLEVSPHTRTILGRLLSSDKQWINYEKEMIFKADHLVVVVDEAKERIINLGADPQKVSVISNTLNTSQFPILREHPDTSETILFYAGGITKHRGLQVAIQAIKLISPQIKNIRLQIVGTGSYLPELKKMVRKLSIDDRVEFVGWKNLHELYILLQKADFPIIPHLRSNHTDSTVPHKLFQYLYINKPVVVSDCKPLKRIIEETMAGIVYRNNSPNELAEVLLKLVTEKDYSSRFRNKGRKWVEGKYNWKEDAGRLIKLYELITE